jgi:hypothetical protein
LHRTAAGPNDSRHLADAARQPWTLPAHLLCGQRRFAQIAARETPPLVEQPMRHFGMNDGQLDDLMGVRRYQVGKASLATRTHFRKKGNGGRRCHQPLLMAGMTGLAARPAALGSFHPAVALCRGGIC